MTSRLLAPRSSRLTRAILVASTLVIAAPLVDAGAALATVEGQKAEVQRIVDQLDALHERADILAEDYAVAVDEKSQLEVEIAKAAEQLAGKEAELDTLRGDLAEVAVRTFTGAGADVLGPLFSDASSYSAGLRRDQYSRVALNAGTGTTDDLDELIREIDEERDDLENDRERVEQLAADIVDKQAEVEQLTAEYLDQRADAEARLGELIVEEEERRSQEAFRQLQVQAAQIQASSNDGGSDNGGAADDGGGAVDDGGGAVDNGGGGDTGGTVDNGGGGDAGGGDAGGGGGYVPVSGLSSVAIDAAMGQRGVPYVYATSNPGQSFDCSGLTHYAWGQAGVYLPRNSRAQAAATPHVPIADAQPGDLLFYYSPISHVGIYLGGGQLVHAPATGDVVKVASVNWNKVTVVSRPG
jgi:cell wall-associated NlpC family hydrolase